ncbi:alpha/beta fold hydrolase [Sorangium sp. So ce1099]|uniref:alpha/beta fold hydrolase n=1 Tax=Sorangium sp. So ce1099 TaxID=3133331 RepID=UPI003F5D9A83
MGLLLLSMGLACGDAKDGPAGAAGASGGAGGSGAGAGSSGGGGTGGSGGGTGGSGEGTGGSGEGTGGSGGGTGGSGGGTPSEVVSWGACPEGYQSECAILALPLDHGSPGGETIEVHIARRKAAVAARRQVWLLAGGPGQGGHVFFNQVTALAATLPDADLYVIDHRGTGYSHRLTCPQQDVPDSYGGFLLAPRQVPDCLEHLETTGDRARLAWFTMRQAALDVLASIDATREPGQEVYVWGGSYGTYWAHRVLQLAAPGAVSGIVFDGFMTPGRLAFTQYDAGVDEAGIRFLQACAADAACAGKMGPDPVERLRGVLAALGDQPCGPFDRSVARTWYSVFMDSVVTRAFVLPFIHRLERCDAADQSALTHLVEQFDAAMSGALEGEPFLNSAVLQLNISLSELWKLPGEPEPTREALEAAADAQLFLQGESYPASIVHLRSTWPLPPPDALDLAVPVPTDMPLLWLAGELDTRTPYTQALAIAELYDGENQPLVMLPGAAHLPSMASPLASDPTKSCGGLVVESFLRGDGADTSCTEDLLPLQFSLPSAEASVFWWGVEDEWGDTPAARSPAPAPRRPAPGPSPRLSRADLSPSVVSWILRRRQGR